MQPSQARILHFGRPTPPALRAALEPRFLVLDEVDSREAVDVVLVPEDQFHHQLLARIRGRYPRGLIVGVAMREVAIFERVQWIRTGADDLLPEEEVEAGVVRLLSRQGSLTAPPVSSATNATRAVERYLQEIVSYIGQRAQLTSRLGQGGMTRFVELSRRRDTAVHALMSSPQDELDDQAGVPRWEGVRCTWPMSIRLPYVEKGQILRFGGDTLQILVPGVLNLRDRLQLRVEAGNTAVLLDLEILWPQVTAGGRSIAAALITEALLERSA